MWFGGKEDEMGFVELGHHVSFALLGSGCVEFKAGNVIELIRVKIVFECLELPCALENKEPPEVCLLRQKRGQQTLWKSVD